MQNKLANSSSERDYLKNGTKIALGDIENEREKQFKCEKDLDNLRGNLLNAKSKNKGLAFELENLTDEIVFRKAVFLEESSYLRTKFNGTILNKGEVANFYKKELALAIDHIKRDFEELNRQQLREYQEIKERELAYNVKISQEDDMIKKQKMIRLEQTNEIEKQTAVELHSASVQLKDEHLFLNRQYDDLLKRLSNYEHRLEEMRLNKARILEELSKEIILLREQNKSYLKELDYWSSVTRSKLEAEILTFRSLLNSRSKLMTYPETNQSWSNNTKVDQDDSKHFSFRQSNFLFNP